MTEEDFLFTAFTVNSREDERFVEKTVVLSMMEQDERSEKYFRGVWHKMCSAARNFHESAPEQEGPAPAWCSWEPHDWYKAKILDRKKFAAWDGNAIVGFLNVRLSYPSQCYHGKQLLYIEHLATAPGNFRTGIWCRQLKHVGTAVMAYAVLQSHLNGTEGLIGLHASDDVACNYYRALHLRRGNLFNPEMKGIVGTPQDRKATERFYFESTFDGASALLEDYRRA